MQPQDPPRFPLDTARDLLGIVRALYALERKKGNHGRAQQLRDAGAGLKRALELAVHGVTVEAWRLADDAIATIARMHGTDVGDLASVVELASNRVKNKRSVLADRNARRQARIKRG